VSGWEHPTPPGGPGPVTHWAQSDTDLLGPGRLIRRGLRLYRSVPRRLLTIAAITGGLQTLLSLPALASSMALAQGVVDVLADYLGRVMANPEAYRPADQQALQAELEARLRAVIVSGSDLPVVSAVGSGLGGAIGLVGLVALTAMALSMAAGRPVPVPFAFRLVAARAGLVIPIVALGAGWMAVAWFSSAVGASPDVQTWAGAPGSPRSVLIGSLLSVLAVVVAVGVVFLAVRWALYVPAVLVESLGVGRGLARAARLTLGVRIRLGLAMAGVLLLQALALVVVATIAGFVVGIAAGSVTVGFGVYVVVGVVINVLWAPWLPAMFAIAYRDRTQPADGPAEGPAGRQG
jgi:hypothetical protein